MMEDSVFEKHSKEIEIYERASGKDAGRLIYASAILSDLIEMCPEEMKEEIREVKELIGSVVKSISRKKSEGL